MEDQVVRLEVFRTEHPDWEIRPPIDPTRGAIIPQWRATSPDGTMAVFEDSLAALLDALDKLV